MDLLFADNASICRLKHEDKIDIYDFGVIFLEIITGRPLVSSGDVEAVKDQVWVHIDGWVLLFSFISSLAKKKYFIYVFFFSFFSSIVLQVEKLQWACNSSYL